MLDALNVELVEGGARDAAAGPHRIKLCNARLISALWHGEGCVGLSGLFAIVNAIRLAVADRHIFTSPELHALLATGFEFMDGRLTPRQTVLTGLRVNLWRRVAETMVEAASLRTGIRIGVERLYSVEPWSRQAAFDVLGDALVRMRVPLILCQGGHYTVVSGVTDLSVLLFDSGAACWLTKRLCGVPRDCIGARHIIYPSSFIALVA